MRRSLILTITAMTLVGLAGCGSTTDTATPADRSPTNPDVRADILELSDEVWEEYPEVLDVAASMGSPPRTDEERIDSAIQDACFPGDPAEEAGVVAPFMGASLVENGHDVAGLMEDIAALNAEVTELVDCSQVTEAAE